MRRVVLALVGVASCATADPVLVQRMRRTSPAAAMFDEIWRATSEHHEVALVDSAQATIVTAAHQVEGTNVVYVVRMAVSAALSCSRNTCPRDPVVTITPVGFRDGHQLAYEAIPRSAREHVAELMLDIRESLRDRGIAR